MKELHEKGYYAYSTFIIKESRFVIVFLLAKKTSMQRLYRGMVGTEVCIKSVPGIMGCFYRMTRDAADREL